MQRVICENLKNAIEDLDLQWSDKICGMVETIQEKVLTTGGGTVVKSYPAYRAPQQVGCNTNQDYTRCLPETSLKSLIYIEANGPQQDAHTWKHDEYTMRVNIIVWLNLKKINSAYVDSSDIVDEFISEMPKELPNIAPYHTIRTKLVSVNRDQDVINKYSYDEAEKQYFIYPFDFAVVSYDIKFRRTGSCARTTASDPTTCYTY